MKNVSRVLELCRAFGGLRDILLWELPPQHRNESWFLRYVEEQLSSIQVFRIKEEVLAEKAELGPKWSSEFHLISTAWRMPLGSRLQRIVSLYPGSSTQSIAEAMRGEEELQKAYEVAGYGSQMEWDCLVSVRRNLKSQKITIAIYNLEKPD